MSRKTQFASRWLRRLAQLGVLGFGVAMVLGWFGHVHRAFDSFATFRMFFGVGLLASLILLVPFARWRWVVSGTVIALVSVLLSLPHLPGMKRGWAVAGAAPLEDKPTIRVAQSNILFSNGDYSELAQTLIAADADVILLQEVRRENRAILERLRPTHPHILDCTPGRWHSVAIASRLPFGEQAADPCPPPSGLGIATVLLGERPLNVVTFHAWWPWPRNQHYQTTEFASVLSDLNGPTILGGDFNAAPWAASVARMGDAISGKAPAGLLMTWNPGGLVSWLPDLNLLPLDHMLTSPDFGLLTREKLPSGGSDHHPVVSEYVLLN